MTGRLYLLVFSNGKYYVGLTRGTIANRLRGHRRRVASGVSFPIYAAWRKHGEPLCVPLGEVPHDELGARESEMIAALGAYGGGGYNATPGGERPPENTAEIRAKISAAHRANGHRPSPQCLAARIAAVKGKKQTPEHIAKCAASRRGKKRGPMSADQRAKLSATLKERGIRPARTANQTYFRNRIFNISVALVP